MKIQSINLYNSKPVKTNVLNKNLNQSSVHFDVQQNKLSNISFSGLFFNSDKNLKLKQAKMYQRKSNAILDKVYQNVDMVNNKIDTSISDAKKSYENAKKVIAHIDEISNTGFKNSFDDFTANNGNFVEFETVQIKNNKFPVSMCEYDSNGNLVTKTNFDKIFIESIEKYNEDGSMDFIKIKNRNPIEVYENYKKSDQYSENYTADTMYEYKSHKVVGIAKNVNYSDNSFSIEETYNFNEDGEIKEVLFNLSKDLFDNKMYFKRFKYEDFGHRYLNYIEKNTRISPEGVKRADEINRFSGTDKPLYIERDCVNYPDGVMQARERYYYSNGDLINFALNWKKDSQSLSADEMYYFTKSGSLLQYKENCSMNTVNESNYRCDKKYTY